MQIRRTVVILAAALLAFPAWAETPAFDPRDWKGTQAGSATQVLTLGSAHLSQLEAAVTPEMMEPLLAKLAAFKPDIITHEGISGEQCDVLKRYSAKYPGMFDSYCWDTADAEAATGLNVVAASAEVAKVMAEWPAAPTVTQRRHLAALFIAAGDRPSARVQWLQLPPAERKIGDGIDAALFKILTPAAKKPNETYAIAAALAARLGLQRLYAVDDHTADAVQAEAGPGFEPYMRQFWSGMQSPVADEDRQRGGQLKTGADVLDYYRFMNRPETQRAFVTLDYRRAMSAASPQGYGRAYLAWWEVRNLRMVSNIRAAFGTHPGARVLNVVGASHKPYYDAYLGMMSDVTLVDAETVLK